MSKGLSFPLINEVINYEWQIYKNHFYFNIGFIF